MQKDKDQFLTHQQFFEIQAGVQLSEEVQKGLAGCTVYRGVDSEGNKLVVKVGTSEKGREEIDNNLYGYQAIESLGAKAITPFPIKFIESDFGPVIIMPDLGADFLMTSVDPISTKSNFDALTSTLEEIYGSIRISSPEANIMSLQNILEKLSDRIAMLPDVGLRGYELYSDLRGIDIKSLVGEASSLFILDFTPSNLFIVDGKAKFIDPWKQSIYHGSPILSLAQFITYAEDAYEVPGFNDENLQYSEFVHKVGRNLGLSDEQIKLQYKIGQSLQYSLSAYYRIQSESEKEREKAIRFMEATSSNIDELREYSLSKTSPRFIDTRTPEFWQEAYPQLVDLYIAAFSSSPWNLTLARDYTEKRLKDHFSKDTCRVIICESNGKIVGATWFDQPSLDELSNMRGSEIASFTQNQLEQQGVDNFIWMRETLVYPHMQRKGIGESLRLSFSEYAEQTYPQGVLVLTRHREDNEGILKLSHREGYKRVGIKQQFELNGKIVDNDFWYKFFNVFK